jgi:hypothetical protein
MSVATNETTSSPSRPKSAVPKRSYRLNASAYDQVSSGLFSALLFVGATVLAILMLYFSSKLLSPPVGVPVTMTDVPSEGSARGTGTELNEPGGDDVPDELQQDAPVESVETITAAVTSNSSQFDDLSLETSFTSGKGGGKGDGRGTGRGKAPQEDVPRAQRWTIRFDGGNIKTYAKQLDFFGIELAAVGGSDNLVHYAFNVSKPKPDQRTGPSESENRLYMTWRSGPLQSADRELLTKAGVDISGRVIMQFYPAATEQTLAQLERAYAGNRDINEVRRTIFDVRVKGDKFEFFVTGQQLF